MGEPDLDVLVTRGQTGEPGGAGGPFAQFDGLGGHVDRADPAASHRGLGSETAVDQQVVYAVRRGRQTSVSPLGGQGVQFDGGGPGAKGQPHAGGLGFGHGELVVGDLPASPSGQPVRQQAAVRGAFQVESAAQDVRGDGCGDPVVLGVHCLSLLIKISGLLRCAGARRGRLAVRGVVQFTAARRRDLGKTYWCCPVDIDESWHE